MKSVSLKSYPRTLTKRSGSKRLREGGRIPAVVYGPRIEPRNVEVGEKEVTDIIKHSATENVLIDLSIDGEGEKRLALIQDVQHHVLSGRILHIDFREVAPDERVVITVPVESYGESVGVKVGGGVLEHVLFNLKVRALPKDLPEAILVDVTNLETGQSLHISDLPAPEGVEILGDKKIVVMSVAQGRVQAATPQEEAAAAAVAK